MSTKSHILQQIKVPWYSIINLIFIVFLTYYEKNGSKVDHDEEYWTFKLEQCCLSIIVHNFLKKCLQAILACLHLFQCLVGVCKISNMGGRGSKWTQQLQIKKCVLNPKCGWGWLWPRNCFFLFNLWYFWQKVLQLNGRTFGQN